MKNLNPPSVWTVPEPFRTIYTHATEIPSGDRRQLLISLSLSRRFSFLALRPAGWPDLPILYSTIQSSHSEYFAHSTAAGRNHGH